METDILQYAENMNCSELHMVVDKKIGLKGIIAIHSTALGPALGGCRCVSYPNSTAAVIDAVRLAKGMSYKSALAELPLGGGKMVLLKPAEIVDRVAYFKAVGDFVNKLNGRYITAVDSGTSVEDMDIIATQTKHVTSISHGFLSIPDPSLLTAEGVFRGIEAAVEFKLKRKNLEGLRVTIQGVGHAGYRLAKLLHEAGAKLIIYDINRAAMQRCVEEFNAEVTESMDELFSTTCDVFAPSALGGILNDYTIPLLKASIVAGCANNQLEKPEHAKLLDDHGILYAPDVVVNAGGVIYVAAQYTKDEKVAKEKVNAIYNTLLSIFERAQKENKLPNDIADEMALERIQRANLKHRGM